MSLPVISIDFVTIAKNLFGASVFNSLTYESSAYTVCNNVCVHACVCNKANFVS